MHSIVYIQIGFYIGIMFKAERDEYSNILKYSIFLSEYIIFEYKYRFSYLRIYSYIRILDGKYSNIKTFKYDKIFYGISAINTTKLNMHILCSIINYTKLRNIYNQDYLVT